jgi:hypothetical protein
VVAQPASRLEERTSRGPSRHTLVWTNATLVWPNNDVLTCALRRSGLGNGTQSDQQAHGQHSTHWLCSTVPLS